MDNKCIENLDEIEVDVCGTNDGSHSSFVDWIECQICQILYDKNCVDIEESDDLIFYLSFNVFFA